MTRLQGKQMKWAMASISMLLLTAGTSAHADLVGNKLYESTTLVTQSQIDLQTLNISGAGTVMVKLTDLKWPDLLGTLSFTLFNATQVIAPLANDSFAFHVDTAGTYYASIFASSKANSGGLYNAQIYFQSAAPVPLPAAGWLMISGLAGLAALRPKQKLSQKYA